MKDSRKDSMKNSKKGFDERFKKGFNEKFKERRLYVPYYYTMGTYSK